MTATSEQLSAPAFFLTLCAAPCTGWPNLIGRYNNSKTKIYWKTRRLDPCISCSATTPLPIYFKYFWLGWQWLLGVGRTAEWWWTSVMHTNTRSSDGNYKALTCGSITLTSIQGVSHLGGTGLLAGGVSLGTSRYIITWLLLGKRSPRCGVSWCVIWPLNEPTSSMGSR